MKTSVCLYLPGGECGRAAVSSVVLAVGPVVDGVTPPVPSEGLDRSHKQENITRCGFRNSAHKHDPSTRGSVV